MNTAHNTIEVDVYLSDQTMTYKKDVSPTTTDVERTKKLIVEVFEFAGVTVEDARTYYADKDN